MKFSKKRIDSLIRRDPLEVAYTADETDVTTTGLMHRRKADRAGSETEGDAGTSENERLRVMIEMESMGGHLPEEGMRITVGGVDYRCDAPEIASDLSHIIVPLLDVNG